MKENISVQLEQHTQSWYQIFPQILLLIPCSTYLLVRKNTGKRCSQFFPFTGAILTAILPFVTLRPWHCPELQRKREKLNFQAIFPRNRSRNASSVAVFPGFSFQLHSSCDTAEESTHLSPPASHPLPTPQESEPSGRKSERRLLNTSLEWLIPASGILWSR